MRYFHVDDIRTSSNSHYTSCETTADIANLFEACSDCMIREITETEFNKSQYPVIGVTQGMSGYFAVMYWWNPEGFPEPYETGFGRYPDRESAVLEARAWASCEDIKLDPSLLPTSLEG